MNISEKVQLYRPLNIASKELIFKNIFPTFSHLVHDNQ